MSILTNSAAKVAKSYSGGVIKQLIQLAVTETAKIVATAIKQTITSTIIVDFLDEPLAYNILTKWVIKNFRQAQNNLMATVIPS